MQAIRQVAFMSTARGCGFASLAIVTAVFGFLDTPAFALKLGGVFLLLSTAILILKAWRAPAVPYKRTEVWLLLPEDQRPNKAFAQEMIVAARVEAFYRFAYISATLSAILLTGALIGAGLAD
jgi:hypothetical protein